MNWILLFLCLLPWQNVLAAPPTFYTKDLSNDPIPETVAIVKKNSLGHVIYCSGVAVSPRKVLTAAHCVAYGDGDGLRLPIQDYAVYLGNGVPYRELNAAEVANLFFAEQIVFHPLYGKTKYQFAHDLAVITLKRDLPFPVRTKILSKLPADDFDWWMAGYGVREMTENGEWISGDEKSVFILPSARSERYYLDEELNPNELGIIDRTFVLGTCKGDSGGPVYVSLRGELFLYALTTTGPMKEYTDPSGGRSKGRCGFDSRATILDRHQDFLRQHL